MFLNAVAAVIQFFSLDFYPLHLYAEWCCVLHVPADMLLLLYGCCTIAIWWRWSLFGSLSIFSSFFVVHISHCIHTLTFPIYVSLLFFFVGSYIVFPFSLSLKAMRYAVVCSMYVQQVTCFIQRDIYSPKWSMIQCNVFVDPWRGAHFSRVIRNLNQIK